jgi:hypothetical protein
MTVTATQLLTSWVLVSIFVLVLGVVNAVSIVTLEQRINDLDHKGLTTTISILKNNWTLLLLLFVGLCSLLPLLLPQLGKAYEHTWVKLTAAVAIVASLTLFVLMPPSREAT